MKQIFIFLMTLITIINSNFVTYGFAQSSYSEEIKIVVDGEEIDSEISPIIVDERVLVPIRVVAEKMGCLVKWDADSQSVGIYSGEKEVLTLIIDNNYAVKNKVQQLFLDVPAKLYGGYTYIPLRAAAESLGAHVAWNDLTHTVTVTSGQTMRELSDFAFLYHNMDISDIFVMVGTPDSYNDDNTEIVYKLTNERNLYLYSNAGKLESIILENMNGVKIPVGYRGEIEYVDLISLLDEYKNDDPLVDDKGLLLLSRADCIIFTMLAIGSKQYNYSVNENFYFADENYHIVGSDMAEEYWRNYNSGKLLFDHMMDLVCLSYLYTPITNGRFRCGPDNQYVYVDCFEFVTLKEAVTFLIRCLEKQSDFPETTNDAFELAKEKGLIKQSDEFYDMPDKKVILREFKTIYERFLNLPRGLYHSPGYYTTYEFDENGSITYYDLLCQYYSEDYVKKLLNYDGATQWTELSFENTN